MTEREIILALCGTIVGLAGVIGTLGIYIKSVHKGIAKAQNEDKESRDENTKEMSIALTKASIAIDNNSRVMEKCTEALNIVKYRKDI